MELMIEIQSLLHLLMDVFLLYITSRRWVDLLIYKKDSLLMWVYNKSNIIIHFIYIYLYFFSFCVCLHMAPIAFYIRTVSAICTTCVNWPSIGSAGSRRIPRIARPTIIGYSISQWRLAGHESWLESRQLSSRCWPIGTFRSESQQHSNLQATALLRFD